MQYIPISKEDLFLTTSEFINKHSLNEDDWVIKIGKKEYYRFTKENKTTKETK